MTGFFVCFVFANGLCVGIYVFYTAIMHYSYITLHYLLNKPLELPNLLAGFIQTRWNAMTGLHSSYASAVLHKNIGSCLLLNLTIGPLLPYAFINQLNSQGTL